MAKNEMTPMRRFTGSSTTKDVLQGVDLTGVTVAITGTTNGIGVETARSMALAGAHVVQFVRNVVAGEALKASIIKEKSSCRLDVVECDLASLSSVQRAAHSFMQSEWPLHVLILNGGMAEATTTTQADGLNTIVGVNHLAGYHLATLLMDVMARTATSIGRSSRVVFVASGSHKQTPLPANLTPQMLTKELLFAPQTSVATLTNVKYYGTSKLCNVWSAAYLQRRHGERGINFYSLHPGALIPTNIGKSFLVKLLMKAASPFTKSIEQGAATSVFCATAKELDGGFGAGKYFTDAWIASESGMAKDVLLQDQMARVSDKQIRDLIPTNI